MRAGWYRRLRKAALPEPDAHVPWRPTGCTVDCLRLDTPPKVSPLLRPIRLCALGVCVVVMLCLVATVPPGGRLARWVARVGSHAGLATMGVALRAAPSPHIDRGGSQSPKGVLVVSGHMSWLDILVLQAVHGPMRMLAMKELASWPVLGWLARRVGTVFIDRDRLLALPGTVAELTTALRAGEVVGAFPGGATTCGRHALRWRNAVFQAAIDAGAEVLVVRLAYRAAGESTNHAALLRRETVWSSLWRVLRLRRLSAELSWEWLARNEAVSTRRTLAATAAELAFATGSRGENVLLEG